MTPSLVRTPAAVVALTVLAAASPAGAQPRPAPGSDPAARGLDLFAHGAGAVIAGDVLALDLRAYGFANVTTATPLRDATVVATWDPETLGGVMKAPPDVTVTTGALGEARLEIPVPPGGARKLALLVDLRHGAHARTRKIEVTRVARSSIELHVPDAHVVPGSETPAWIAVTDARTGRALPSTPVDVALVEGTIERSSVHLTTDASGLARSTFFIPPGISGSPPLSLRARLEDGVETALALGLREETPAMPRLAVKWKEPELKPGQVGHAEIGLFDAAGEPLAARPASYWIGPRGTTPPSTDEDWKKNGSVATTDGLGRVLAEAQAPQVVTSLGSDLTIVVRAEIEGQKLEAKRALPVGQPVATASLTLEGGALVPGIAQRAYLHVSDGEHGVPGEFALEADGLRTRATTDARGDAEITWTVPDDIGAARSVGPCAGGVAASVVVRATATIPALARHPEPFQLCVAVDRDRTSLLRAQTQVVHVGDKSHAVRIASKRAASGIASVVVKGPQGNGWTAWTSAASPGDAEIDLANATPGVHEITLAVPRPANAKEAETATTRILVLPRILPKLTAKVVGGRHAPGGDAQVEITLDDGHGKPLIGEVTAVVVDEEGGGDTAGIEGTDTRASLCAEAGAPAERCDAFLEGDSGAERDRRAALSIASPQPVPAVLDPAARASEELKKTFSDVLHSLEGAIYQSQTPESQRDVRRRAGAGWTFNPELMTLVTAAMAEPPTTPGGEPFGLADLLAIDRQVTFDNVARRVTRLKIFNALAAVRSYTQGEGLGADEPALGDPNALLRRLVREERITADSLRDPWGGTLQFVRTGGPAVPFLTVTKGFALQSPGPDGRPGTGDDVKDPFERVVAAGSPYSTAMGEDEIVDARWNMRVAEATVSGWQEMFARLTGSELGKGEGTGTGQGFGTGHGMIGGSHASRAPAVRLGRAIAMDSTRWTAPVRTDAGGKARLSVPLGDYETTWRIALVGRTDAGQPAVAAVRVPAFLPLSAQVDVGRALTVGDRIAARIVVRNRTAAARSVNVEVSADGALAVATGQRSSFAVDVPPSSLRSVFAQLDAKSVGQGNVRVALRAAGTDGDRALHQVMVEPAGEARVVSTVLASLGPGASEGALHATLPPGYEGRGAPRLVLESGFGAALIAALDAATPDAGLAPDALADAVEIAARVEKVAEAAGMPWLVLRARKSAAFARGYLAEHERGTPSPAIRLASNRSKLFAPPPPPGAHSARGTEDAEALCPKESELGRVPVALFLEAEPPPSATGPLPCFSALAGKVEPKSAVDLARITLALADRPHRAAMALATAKDLARITHADSGKIDVSSDESRPERAIILAALARSAPMWSKDPGAAARMAGRLLALRDARGGYGSSEATRDAVRALVALDVGKPPATRVVVHGDRKQVVELRPNGGAVIPLAPQTSDVAFDMSGGPVLARLERPALRSFLGPPDTSIAPVEVTTDWPNDAKAGTTGVVHVSYSAALGHDVAVWTRLPLPPGVELAAPVKDVVLRQGVVHIRTTVGSSATIPLPVRFTLPGRVLVREAETTTTSEEQPRALTPARLLVVRP